MLNNAPKKIQNELFSIIKNNNQNNKKIKRAIDLVVKYKGISYASEKMKHFTNKALSLIENFPENEAKKALKALVKYTINREK